AKVFYENIRNFLPFIELEDLSPDTSGIRPKLQGPQDEFRDFIINDENANGLFGFVNLIGIESSGLTSSLCYSQNS
ncbi:MAG: NAD(P)/FAD-dependent oxidoreductase, partial [Candidatus Omnitrophica bacterium]|nr:NAD(P)/FAD-dependent oxidoreductase [Candidatus Omnitrophota bacterium]